jgi:ligand-binding sensor domain-containing protein/two-component sensor histidine kinase
MKLWYSSLLVILLPLAAVSQMPDYHVQVFDESSGIRNFNTRSMIRDQKDFLWILYDNKIQRFDGRQVKDFYLPAGLLFSIICDSQDRIWCTSRNGVYRFKNDHSGFVPVQICDTALGVIGYIFELSDHHVYLHTGKRFYVFDDKKNCFLPFQVLAIPKVPINSIKMGTWGTHFFFATSDSLYSFDVSTKILSSLPGKSVFAINALNDHLVLLSDWKFASYWFDFDKKTVTPVNTGKLSEKNGYLFTNDLISLGKNQYIITTENGPLKYDDSSGLFSKLILFREGHILQDMESLLFIYMDNSRNVWMSYGQGLIRFQADDQNLGLMRNAFAQDKKFKWNNDVRKFAEDEKGNIWFATVNGFNYWDLSTGKITHYPGKINDQQFLYPSIRGISYDGKYLVLGPTNLGVWLFDPKAKRYRRPNYPNDSNGLIVKKKIESDFIANILLLRNGDHLITAKDGVYILTAKTYFLKELNVKGKTDNYQFSYQDSRGRIWIGSRNKLYCYDSSYRYLFTAPPIGDGWPRCIWEKNENEFMIGSDGLFSLDISSKPFRLKKVDPYFDHSILNFIFKDKKSRFWIGSDNGLFLYDLQSKKIRSFDYANNLQGKGFYHQSIFLSSKGILYIGGTNGINYFRPETIEILNEKLKPVVLNMVVNDDDSSFLEKSLPAKLSYSSNAIRFDFVAPYFSNASKVQYRYTLSGLDDQWKYVQNNTSVYVIALAAGDYSFKVAASVNGKDWYESESIHFIILPPFWKTWWFVLTCIILFCSIVYMIYRYRIAQIMKLQLVRNRISAELHDDIGTKLTNINILSTLTHQAMEEPVKARELLGRISTEVQTSSEALDDIVWNINTRNDSLQEIIPRMRRYASEVLSGKNIQFNIRVPDNLQNIKFPMEKRHDVYLLFKEIVNNIHKHADAAHVIVDIEIHDAAFFLQVKDNGKGFDSSQQTNRNGLQNLKARTEKWKGELVIQSTKGTGTAIKIVLPLKKIHSNGL